MAPTPTVMGSLSLTTHGGMSRLTSTTATSPPIFLAYRSEATKLRAYKSETMKLPMLTSRTSFVIPTPVKAILAP